MTKERDEQIDSLYKAIGKFIVAFEQMCDSMQHGIIFLLSQQGLKNQNISNILLAKQTAEPLRSLYRALIAESLMSLNADEIRLIDYLFVQVQELIAKRNDIIHATWYIGYGNEQTTDWSKAVATKSKTSNKGLSHVTTEHTKETLESVTEEVLHAQFALHILSACFSFGFNILKNLKLGEGEGIKKIIITPKRG